MGMVGSYLILASCSTLVENALDDSPPYVEPQSDDTATLSVRDENPKGPEITKLWITHVDGMSTTSFTKGLKTVQVSPGPHTVRIKWDLIEKLKSAGQYYRSRSSGKVEFVARAGEAYGVIKSDYDPFNLKLSDEERRKGGLKIERVDGSSDLSR